MRARDPLMSGLESTSALEKWYEFQLLKHLLRPIQGLASPRRDFKRRGLEHIS